MIPALVELAGIAVAICVRNRPSSVRQIVFHRTRVTAAIGKGVYTLTARLAVTEFTVIAVTVRIQQGTRGCRAVVSEFCDQLGAIRKGDRATSVEFVIPEWTLVDITVSLVIPAPAMAIAFLYIADILVAVQIIGRLAAAQQHDQTDQQQDSQLHKMARKALCRFIVHADLLIHAMRSARKTLTPLCIDRGCGT